MTRQQKPLRPTPPRPGPDYVKKYTGLLENLFGTKWVQTRTMCGPRVATRNPGGRSL